MDKQHPLAPCVSTEDLKQAINARDNNTLVFDCRFALGNPNYGLLSYEQGHIPGAYFLDIEADLSAPVEGHGGRHPLPRIGELQDRLRSCGLTRFHTVVVYDDQRNAYAARAWWLFRFMGLENVFILDGGYQAWKDSGGGIDKREPAPKPGNFSCNPRAGWITDYQGVQIISQSLAANKNTELSQDDGLHNACFDKHCLIDAREEKRYQGIEEPIDPIAGHIPGACNLPWQDVVDEKGFFKPLAFHQDRWAFIEPQQTAINYCGSGVTACVNLASQHIAGQQNAMLYPGSWSDWCSYL